MFIRTKKGELTPSERRSLKKRQRRFWSLTALALTAVALSPALPPVPNVSRTRAVADIPGSKLSSGKITAATKISGDEDVAAPKTNNGMQTVALNVPKL